MLTRLNMKTTPERSRLMARVRQSGTLQELSVRRLLRSLGIPYSTKSKGLPGSPDLVNRSTKWAIFVHGCFWHAHQGCSLWKIPKNNRSFWCTKFQSNIERDNRKLKELKKFGYSVLIIWGCELRHEAKARRKIFGFMQKLHNKPTNGKALSAVQDNSEPIANKRESYKYTASKKFVTRTIKLDDSKTFSTRLCVKEGCDINGDPQSIFDQSLLRQSKCNEPNEVFTTIRVVDLFCGCGGLSLGAKEACSAIGYGFESLLAIDNDSESLAVYKANFNPECTHEKDIRKIIDGKRGAPLTADEKALLRDLKEIDILLAGPPCQGHSDLNNHTRRKDRRNGLYGSVGRFAELTKPKYILIENIPNVIHSHDHTLRRTIKYLLNLGYKVDTGVVDLSELGTPQRRKRHVLVASLNDVISVERIVEKHRAAQVHNIRWAIADLEKKKVNGIFTTPGKHSEDNLKRIDYLFEREFYDLPDHMRPPCHRNGHTYKSMYGRMKYDEPAQTITSGFGCPGQGRFIHPTRRRALTPHEAARLQFFPDFFDFSSVKTRTALANMIGNAVPMKLAYVFCLEFLIGQYSKRSLTNNDFLRKHAQD